MNKIYVVEDDAIVGIELTRRLTALGYDVCGKSARGDVALREIETSRPDLVLMDLRSSGPTDGLDLAERLRDVYSVPVVFLTTDADAETAERASRGSSHTYLIEPFDPTVLRAYIELALVRHEARRALRESERRFRSLFEQASVGVAEIDTISGRYIQVNRKFCEIVGYSADELSNIGVAALCHPDDVGAEAAQVASLRRGEVPAPGAERRYRRKDGTTVWADVAMAPLWSPGEQPTRHAAIVTDVTARRKAQVALESSERHFAGLVAASPVGVYETDAAGRCVYVNETWSSITGLSLEESVDDGWIAAVHPDDQTLVLEELARATEDTRPFRLEFRFRRSDGKTTWVYSQSVTLLEGEAIVGYIGTITDITVLREARLELAKREEFLRVSQEVAAVGSWDWDVVGGGMRWSEQMYRLHQRDPSTFAPSIETALEFYDAGERERVGRCIASSLRGNGIGSDEFHLTLPDGTLATHRVSWKTYYDANRRPIRVIGANVDVSERLRSERAVRSSEERFRRLFEDSLEGIYQLDPVGTILRVNKAFAQLLGLDSPDELVGRTLQSLYHDPRDLQRIQSALQESDTVSGIQTVWRRNDGELVHMEHFGRAIRSEAGKRIGYQGSVRDITHERQYALALQTLSTELSRVSPGAFFEEVALQIGAIVGAEIGFVGTLLDSPASRLRTLAISVDGVLQPELEFPLGGTPCEVVLHGGTQVFPRDVGRLFPNHRFPAEWGVQAYVATPLVHTNGAIIGVVGVMSRKPIARPEWCESIVKLFAVRSAAELERQRADERFASAFEHSPDAVVIANGAGQIVLANRMAESLLLYERHELLALRIEDLIPVDLRAGHEHLRSRFIDRPSERRMGALQSNLQALRKDGKSVRVEISLSPLRTEDGPLVVAAIRDVTQRVKMEVERTALEEQLRQAQKMESLGTLAGGIAHDFNNLLASIVANVDLARLDGPPSGTLVESLDGISLAASRATELVKQILAFSRQQPMRRSVASPRDVVVEVARLLRATLPAGIRLETALEDSAPGVSMDSTQIHQVVMNLATNAWHAIARTTGTIVVRFDTVDVGSSDARRMRVETGRHVRIQVVDDGRGMERATMERIFEPFFTTKGVGEGTGLGLAVAHGIVADHKGAITVESEVGRGTTFTVFLPIVSETFTPEESVELDFDVADGEVLVIDDEEALARAGRLMIERLGYRAVAVTRGADAIAAIRAEPGRFDAVLADLNMPDLNGMEVAMAIRSLGVALPVILMSGYHVHDREACEAAGVRYILDKPFTLATLGRVLEKAVGLGRALRMIGESDE